MRVVLSLGTRPTKKAIFVSLPSLTCIRSRVQIRCKSAVQVMRSWRARTAVRR